MICGNCKSKNTKISENFKWVYDGIPKTFLNEGTTLFYQDFNFHEYFCSDCGNEFFIQVRIEQSGLNGASAGIIIPRPKPVKKRKNVFDGLLTIEESIRLKYLDSNEYRVDEFKEYLKHTSKEIFTMLFSDGSNCQQNYKHRWTKQYQKGIISKLYQFESWVKRHKLDIGMITLTSAQRGYTDLEVLKRLSLSWGKLQDNLNKKGYLCFKLFEPHESGYPHIHVLVIGKISQSDIDMITSLWKDKYNMGDGITDKNNQDHSIKFDLSGGIESLKNYLMKYLNKTIVADILNDELLLSFHSMFYETSMHLYSASRYLYFIMKKFKFKSNIILTHLLIKNKEIYNRGESTAYPCKYQQIDGIRYKYRLAPFEIKNKCNYYYCIDIMNNFNIQKIFKLWDAQLWDMDISNYINSCGL